MGNKTKDQIIEELVALGVEIDPEAKKADLEEILKEKIAEVQKEEGTKEEKSTAAPAPKPSKKTNVMAGRKWVKVEDKEEVMQLQRDKKLIGFNPKTMEALIAA